MIDRNSPEPLFVQLKNMLIARIESGELQPHERIHSERELGEMYNISRQTVRLGINELVLQGLLYRQPGKGTYVAPQKVTQDLLKVTSFTQLILDWGRTTSAEVLSCAEVPVPPFAQQLLQVDKQARVIEYTRLRLVDDQPAAIHRSYIPYPLGVDLLNCEGPAISLVDFLNRRNGLRITHSEETMEPTIADPYEAETLQVKKGAPLQLIRGRLLSEEDWPVECHKSLYRGDKFQFAFEGRLDQEG
jgi:GntR family transcriptional regulator